MVRCCHVKVLIAGLQCRDRWPRKRASRNLRHFTLVCGKSAKRGSHIGWSKSSARHTVPCATHLPADQQKAFGWHLPLFFFFNSSSCILRVGSVQYTVSCIRLYSHLQSALLGTMFCCSIQRLYRTVTAEQLFAYTYCTAVLPTQTKNGDGRRGEWKTVGPHLAQP